VAPGIARGPWGAGGNAGGERTWIAPETGPRGFFAGTDVSRWRVPAELDPGNYAEVPDSEEWRSWRTELTAHAADGASFPIAITRSVRIGQRQPRDPAGVLRLELRTTLHNVGPAAIDRRLGLWNIVQVPSALPGTILIPLASNGKAAALRPYFVDLPRGVLRADKDILYLKAHGGARYKVGLPAASCAGCIAHLRPSRAGSEERFVCLRFTVDAAETYLDKPKHDPRSEAENGDPLQAYNDPGREECAFSEIEAHAPTVRLAPAESQSFLMEMFLATAPAAGMTELAEMLLSRPLDRTLLFS
jgi:hypothetical protein